MVLYFVICEWLSKSQNELNKLYNTTIRSKHVKVKRKLRNCRQVTLSPPPPRSSSLQTLPRLIVTINRVNYFNLD